MPDSNLAHHAPHGSRERLVDHVAMHLEQSHWPRLTLVVILAVAGLAAFLSSYLALEFGVLSMPFRYAVASTLGYLTFLAGIRLWVREYADESDASWDGTAAVDLGGDFVGEGSGAGDFSFSGSGEFSGGGGGRTLDGLDQVPDGDSGVSEFLDLTPDLDESAVVLLPLVLGGALLIGLVGTVTVVIGAPALLAEVAIDVVIAGAVYRRLVRLPPQHWVEGVITRTWKPMLAIAVSAVVVAVVIQWLVPGAHSIGDVFRPLS